MGEVKFTICQGSSGEFYCSELYLHSPTLFLLLLLYMNLSLLLFYFIQKVCPCLPFSMTRNS